MQQKVAHCLAIRFMAKPGRKNAQQKSSRRTMILTDSSAENAESRKVF
jgi:hypothetical protein